MVTSFGRFVRLRAAQCFTACAMALFALAAPASANFFTFESGQVRPLALSSDGSQLFAVNTPDNRLEIFDVVGGVLTHAHSVPVGMEPVAVALRPNGTQAWVVNHLSDSISIVDLTVDPPRVIRTLLVGDEPRDIVFAGPSNDRAFITTAHRGQNTALQANIDTELRAEGIGRADIWAFDASNLGPALGGTPVTGTPVTVFGDTPRALAVSPDGSTVYAAVFHSGNQTATVTEPAVCNGGSTAMPCNLDGVVMPNGLPGGQVPGGLPAPNKNVENVTGPEVGLIVKFNESTNHWEDELARNWNNAIRFSLPDLDVFAINANGTPTETNSFAHVGTILFNMVVNPANGKIYVTNTDANNKTRFEGPGILGTTVRGHLAESHITVLDNILDTVTSRHLNKHIDYNDAPQPIGVKEDSLATPTGMAITGDGATLYVAAFGSSKVGIFNTTQLENNTFTPSSANHITVSGGGPSGLVLDETNDRLYVFTRFDDSISVIDTNSKLEIAHVPVYNPEPASVVNGRPFLYDAHFTSSTGEASCSSCHIFGDFDSLAWDLGNPDDVVKNNPNPGGPVFGGQNFHPMKGPMTTQTLRGMATHGPMHWRGDRTGAYDAPNIEPNSGAFDESAAFKAFNVAFGGLVGRDEGPLTDPQMQAFTDFILQVILPPNPIRDLTNDLSIAETAGLTVFTGPTTDTVTNCDGCHSLNTSLGFFGANGRSTFENETQEFKIAHLSNLYQKIGMFGMPTSGFVQAGDNGDKGPQVRGFGFLHDGSIDTIFRFHRATVFSLNDTQRRNLEALMFAFDTTLAPVVGQQITLTNLNGATVGPRINLFIQSAEDSFVLMGVPNAHECDLIAKGVVAGEERGFLYDPATNLFQSDRDGETYTDAALRGLVDDASDVLTYTCAPPSSGTRMGIDRDEDGFFDSDEIDAGSDPADPSSIPGSGPTPTVTASPTATATPAACGTPLSGCSTAAKGMLLVKAKAGKESLTWKWLKGQQTIDAADLGVPTGSTSYKLCVFTSPQMELNVAGGSGWKATGSGFTYSDPTTAQDGVKKILVKAGAAGKSKALVKGKGSGLLPLPTLPATPPVTVQLQNSAGKCWETAFSSGNVLKNDTQILKLKF